MASESEDQFVVPFHAGFGYLALHMPGVKLYNFHLSFARTLMPRSVHARVAA